MSARPATLVRSNGSKWNGEEPDHVERLLAVLKAHPLDRSFENYGGFVYRMDARCLAPLRRTDPAYHQRWLGAWHIHGNFLTVSHVFSINTRDRALLRRLRATIAANRRRPDYLAQPFRRKHWCRRCDDVEVPAPRRVCGRCQGARP